MKRKAESNQAHGEVPEQIKPYCFKQKGDEPLSNVVTFRVSPTMRQRINQFKAEHGEFPWDKVRSFLDDILPEPHA